MNTRKINIWKLINEQFLQKLSKLNTFVFFPNLPAPFITTVSGAFGPRWWTRSDFPEVAMFGWCAPYPWPSSICGTFLPLTLNYKPESVSKLLRNHHEPCEPPTQSSKLAKCLKNRKSWTLLINFVQIPEWSKKNRSLLAWSLIQFYRYWQNTISLIILQVNQSKSFVFANDAICGWFFEWSKHLMNQLTERLGPVIHFLDWSNNRL